MKNPTSNEDGRDVGNGSGKNDLLLHVRGLQKAFGALHVLAGIDIDLHRGEVAFIIGPSGGGKSTLLRCVNFLVRPDGGSITYGGKPLCWEENGKLRQLPEKALLHARSSMPMVFQHFNLFNHKTVLQNLMEGPIVVQRRDKAEVREAAFALLRQVGLEGKSDRYPAELSGGQKQRVGIARALIMKPQMVLFDEPTSALDPELVADVLATIQGLAGGGLAMMIVSHEMKFARRLADSVHFVADGKVIESGKPETVLENPSSPRLKSFISAVLH